MDKRVAVVTGSNKGIGLGLVKALCQVFEGDVVLTARDAQRGKAAVDSLSQEGLHPKFHQLDITDHSSILSLKDYLAENYGGLDILVNNAGVYMDKVEGKSFAEKVKEQMEINYFGNINCFELLRPLLRAHARVCNVSSMYASITIKKCSPDLVARFTDPDITMEELTGIMRDYVL
ncbi:carbonyl reductase [NADPH] 1 [Biomphalaria glabrata]